MKKNLFIILLSCVSIVSYSQTVTSTSASVPPGTNQGQFNSTNSIVGQFEVPTGRVAREHYTVGYTLYTKPFKNELRMSLGIGTPNSSVNLSGKIVNSTGSTVIDWQSGTFASLYNRVFDISALPAGIYKLNIYDQNNNQVSSIPFLKSN